MSRPAYRLDLVAGLVDGILTALTLGAGHMLSDATPATPGLALRVASAAAVSGAFVFLVAHYADLRGELVEAERQLNLARHGRFATSRLGRAVLRESLAKAATASACTFAGALLPMLAILLPPAGWRVPVTFVAILAALALTGTLSARLGGSDVRRAVLRVVVGGALGLAFTYGVGYLFGTAVH